MAQKRRHVAKNDTYRWYFGIPTFDPGHKFVYMNDLTNPERISKNPMINIAKARLHEKASTQINTINSNLLDNSTKTVKNALDFLRGVADSEREKELTIVKDYQKFLQKLPLKNNRNINAFMAKLNSNILDNPQDLLDFYTELIDYLNIIRTSVDDYINQLKRLQKHQNEDVEMKDLAKDDYRFRAAGDTKSLLNNVIGTATRAQKNAEQKYAGKLREAAEKYLVQSGVISNLSTGEDIAAAFAIVALDIQEQMQKELDATEKSDFVELIDGAFDTIVDNYINADTQQQTKLQQILSNRSQELKNILNSTKNVLNIKKVKVSDIEKRKKLVEKRTNNLAYKDSIHKKLKKTLNNELLDELSLIDFSIGASNTAHGNIFELIEIISSGNSIKIRWNTGADTLHLGSLTLDIAPLNIREQIQPIFSQIEHELILNEQKQRKNRFDTMVESEKNMNDNIQAALDELEEIRKNIQDPEESMFVYHESLKLYKTAEVGEASGFHGRDLVISHYLDKMYSANGSNDLALPQRDELDFLALNLANGAVGGSVKATMENYLSIFAGMLMFDDVQLIAKDAAQKISYQEAGTKAIHLYNLNGVYVPSSMILSFTYASMQNISDAVFRGQAAKASIDTSKADAAISTYLATRPTPIKPQWESVAEQVNSGTTVRITILSGFNLLLNQLFNAI